MNRRNRRSPREHSSRHVALWALLALPACDCGDGSTTLDAGADANDLDVRVSEVGRDVGSRDAGLDADAGHDAGLCPNGRPQPDFPRLCPDETPFPGFREREDGWFEPCNCFTTDPEGNYIPVANSCIDVGPRTVLFDCDWPPGKVFLRARPNARLPRLGIVQVTSVSCSEVYGTEARPEGFYDERYEDSFFVPTPDQDAFDERTDPDFPVDRLCIPSECVFDTPGQPAHCSDDCASNYATRYFTDRSACPQPDAGLPDGGPPEAGPDADAGT